jgi:hypothetical protein
VPLTVHKSSTALRTCVLDIARPSIPAELQRALKNGNLWVAEALARELPQPLSLEDALRLAHLYAAKESPKFERAAMRFLERYLAERKPTLRNLATIVRELDQRQVDE